MDTNRDMNYFLEFYRDTPRQGPGDDLCTRRAFEMLDDLPGRLRVLDVGCGSGKQTVQLADLIDGEIVAVDYYDFFLDVLREVVRREGLEEKIRPVNASMFDLPFEEEEFDLIWSEGAVYILGFEKGFREWRRFLKPGGYMVVSELSWLRRDVPEDLFDYWTKSDEGYPGIDYISAKIAAIEQSGYRPVGHFVLPEHAWLENYYRPLEEQKQAYLKRYASHEDARKVTVQFERELENYKKYKDFYGYVFYLAQKV